MNALKTLSVEEAVVQTGMSQDMVYRLIDSGAVNANKVGRLWRIQEVSLLRWIEQSQGKPAPVVEDDEGAQFGLTKEDRVFS
jgi:excisionase family DNA binding protein